MNNYSTEQLQKIVDDAPEGAESILIWEVEDRDPPEYWMYYKLNGSKPYYYDLYKWIVSDFGLVEYKRRAIKLSDIRAELLAHQFKVGDLVVFTDISCFPSDLLSVTQMTEFETYLSDGMSFRHGLEWLRHATPAEIAAGCRIDESEKPELKSNNYQARLSEAKAHIESLPEWQRQGLSDAMNASHRIDEPASSCGMTALEIDQFGEDLRNKPYVDLPEFEQPDSITPQLDPAKCHKVDPTVYDAPTSRRVGWIGCKGARTSDKEIFVDVAIHNALRNTEATVTDTPEPLTKCELESPVAASQQQIGGDHYTKLAIQPMHYSMANKLNPAQHTIIKYVTRYPDKGGIQDLLKARHTIDLLIERLEGEQGE